MKTILPTIITTARLAAGRWLATLVLLSAAEVRADERLATAGVALPHTDAARAASIPQYQIGATAEKQYSGDGLSVCATEGGARLRCVFQRMEGEVTCEGLWLTSTVTNTVNDRFRVSQVWRAWDLRCRLAQFYRLSKP